MIHTSKLKMLDFVGMSCSDKVISIRNKMAEKEADVLIVSALDEIACKFKI